MDKNGKGNSDGLNEILLDRQNLNTRCHEDYANDLNQNPI